MEKKKPSVRERRTRRIDRRVLNRLAVETLRADLDACSDQVSRLEKQVQQLTKTVDGLQKR